LNLVDKLMFIFELTRKRAIERISYAAMTAKQMKDVHVSSFRLMAVIAIIINN
jgi:hypothetical protein